jgi:hypothetical protein
MGQKKGLIALQTEPSFLPIENQALFRTVKILDISYIAVIYFILAYFVGGIINDGFEKLYGRDYSSKSINVLLLEVLSQIICIGITTYIGRNLVEYIPSPLDGIGGFIHGRVKELTSGSFLNIFLVMFQYSMQDKLFYIRDYKLQQSKAAKNKQNQMKTAQQGGLQQEFAQPIELEDQSQVNLEMTPSLASNNHNYGWINKR